MSKGGGGRPATTTTTTKSEPWEGQKPFLQDVFREAQTLYRAPGPEYYPGKAVASESPYTTQARGILADYASNTAQQAANSLLGAGSFALGPVLYPETNPALRAAAEGAIRPVFEQMDQRMLRNREGAVATGNVGSSRQGVAEALIARDAMQRAFDTTAQMYSTGYGQGLGLFGKALALGPQTIQAGAIPATMLDTVGQQETAREQLLIDEAMRKWAFEQNLPSAKLTEYANLVSGNYGGTAFGESVGAGAPRGNRALGALGGAMAGYQLASMLPAAMAVNPLVGAGAGLLIGLLG